MEEEAALLNGLDSIVGGAFGERIGGCVVGMSPLLACLQTSPIVACPIFIDECVQSGGIALARAREILCVLATTMYTCLLYV